MNPLTEELVYWALAANIPGRELSTREEYGIVFGTAARRTSHLARIKHVLQVSRAWLGKKSTEPSCCKITTITMYSNDIS